MKTYMTDEVLFLVALIMSFIVGDVHGCSLVPGTDVPKMSMEEKVYKAPVVLYGRFLSEELMPPGSTEENFEYSNAIIDLFCILKSKQNITGSSVKIHRYRPQNSCSDTTMELNKEYVLTLSHSTTEADMFDLFEGVILSTAAYDITEGVLATTAGVCGLQDFAEPSTGCPAGQSCCSNIPDDVSPDNCTTTYDGGASSTNSYHKWQLILLTLLPLFIIKSGL